MPLTFPCACTEAHPMGTTIRQTSSTNAIQTAHVHGQLHMAWRPAPQAHTQVPTPTRWPPTHAQAWHDISCRHTMRATPCVCPCMRVAMCTHPILRVAVCPPPTTHEHGPYMCAQRSNAPKTLKLLGGPCTCCITHAPPKQPQKPLECLRQC